MAKGNNRLTNNESSFFENLLCFWLRAHFMQLRKRCSAPSQQSANVISNLQNQDICCV